MNPSNRIRAVCLALAVGVTGTVLGGIAWIADQRPAGAPLLAAAGCERPANCAAPGPRPAGV